MAIYKTFEIALDLKQTSTNPSFYVIEGDTGNKIKITVTDSGSAVDLTGCRVIAVFSKTNGISMQDSEVEDGGIEIGGAYNNEVTISVFAASVAPGNVECELQIYSGEDMTTLITTARYNFSCRRAVMNEDVLQSTNEYPLLIDLITTVEGFEETEAERVAAEKIRQANETARISNETIRNQNEDVREDAEEARSEAETNRVSVESTRVSAESNRVTAETSRVAAEDSRVSAESARATAETKRVSAESNRVTAETSRVAAEDSRVSAESARATAETKRVSAENSRVTAEQERVTAEAERAAAETLRNTEYNKWAGADASATTLAAGSAATVTVSDANGVKHFAFGIPKGVTGDTGSAGYTPVRGTDYWTDDDIAEIKGYVDDAILGGAW